ncbi:hypothetical protein B0H13DRAFT_1861201 [Mycena leptocephala]|nr:hypothetical protein B0H13DRAFT_1861201 [Mycena leptocephala]
MRKFILLTVALFSCTSAVLAQSCTRPIGTAAVCRAFCKACCAANPTDAECAPLEQCVIDCESESGNFECQTDLKWLFVGYGTSADRGVRLRLRLSCPASKKKFMAWKSTPSDLLSREVLGSSHQWSKAKSIG